MIPFNKSTNEELDEKSLNIKQRKSNKSVVNPPKKSSRKSLVIKAVLKDDIDVAKPEINYLILFV